MARPRNLSRSLTGTAQPQSNIAGSCGIGCLLFLVLFFFALVSILSSGSSFDDINNARLSGAAAGQSAGTNAGQAAGFKSAFNEAKARSYEQTVSQLYSTGDYSRPLFFEFAVVIGFFVLGYALQYGVFYLLRAIGLLPDIDWIVLSPEVMEELKTPSHQQSAVSFMDEQKRLITRNPEHG